MKVPAVNTEDSPPIRTKPYLRSRDGLDDVPHAIRVLSLLALVINQTCDLFQPTPGITMVNIEVHIYTYQTNRIKTKSFSTLQHWFGIFNDSYSTSSPCVIS